MAALGRSCGGTERGSGGTFGKRRYLRAWHHNRFVRSTWMAPWSHTVTHTSLRTSHSFRTGKAFCANLKVFSLSFLCHVSVCVSPTRQGFPRCPLIQNSSTTQCERSSWKKKTHASSKISYSLRMALSRYHFGFVVVPRHRPAS